MIKFKESEKMVFEDEISGVTRKIHKRGRKLLARSGFPVVGGKDMKKLMEDYESGDLNKIGLLHETLIHIKEGD